MDKVIPKSRSDASGWKEDWRQTRSVLFCSYLGVHCVHPTLVQPRLPRSCSLHPTARTWLRSSAGVGACPSSRANHRIERMLWSSWGFWGLHGIGFQVKCRRAQPCLWQKSRGDPEGMCQGYNRIQRLQHESGQISGPTRQKARERSSEIDWGLFSHRSSSGQDFFKWVTSMYLQSSRDHKWNSAAGPGCEKVANAPRSASPSRWWWGYPHQNGEMIAVRIVTIEHAGDAEIVFRKKQSLASTCSHSSGREWPHVTTSEIILPSRPIAATCSHWSGRKRPQVTAFTYFTKSVKPVTCGHLQSLERPQQTASDRCSKWPQVTASDRKWLHAVVTDIFRAPSQIMLRNFRAETKHRRWKEKGWLETKEAGPDLRRKRLETKEEASKRKDARKMKRSLHSRHARSLLWNEERWFETKPRNWNKTEWLETKEAGPELRGERLETKEEASKRKHVWKTKGKGANFKTKRDDLKRKWARPELKRERLEGLERKRWLEHKNTCGKRTRLLNFPTS